MVRRGLACALVAVSSLTLASRVCAEGPAVIELFTSQGCSSCPAADRLLGELTSNPSFIAITLPIDVWDYLGWRDTLANPSNTNRWQGYSKARGDRERYTPQAVLNGATHAVGSDRAAIEKAIDDSKQNTSIMSVPLKVSRAADRLTVALPEGEPATAGMVFVWGLAKAIPVTIARGENKGRTVTYHNVVRRAVHLGSWTAKSNRWSVPLRDLAGEGIEIVAVTVQAGTVDKPSFMLGATTTSIH
jgi:hypothetical protein